MRSVLTNEICCNQMLPYLTCKRDRNKIIRAAIEQQTRQEQGHKPLLIDKQVSAPKDARHALEPDGHDQAGRCDDPSSLLDGQAD